MLLTEITSLTQRLFQTQKKPKRIFPTQISHSMREAQHLKNNKNPHESNPQDQASTPTETKIIKQKWDFNKFITKQHEYAEQKQENLRKMQNMAKSMQNAQMMKTPKINPNSLKLTENRSKENLIHRLYTEGKENSIEKNIIKDENCVIFLFIKYNRHLNHD